ncbi:hypothetical protein [Myroides injenensis]|uniref:hypothetical protein n=1 Tax=Myroides injenensis TaxID=1183151 RepID=UPI00028940B0|nr:hypothetical protein [Myroides injenensis]
MNLGDRIIRFVDRILDFFNIIKGYLDNAVALFEKIKLAVLELVDYLTQRVEEITEEEMQTLEEEHFFI